MVFVKGQKGYWLGKKRPQLKDTNALKTMFKKGERRSHATEFKKGQTPWQKGTKGKVKPNKSSFKKGNAPWNKGIKRIGFIPDNYKGEEASYVSKHQWLYRHKGKARICEKCGVQDKRYTWANISGEYKRDFNDYMQLCYSCHKKYDLERG